MTIHDFIGVQYQRFCFELAVPVVREILDHHRRLLRSTIQGPPTRQQLRFACGQLATAVLVLEALGLFREKFPDVDVRISTIRSTDRIDSVINGALDLALVTNPVSEIQEMMPSNDRLHIEPLESAAMVLVCARKCPWSKRFRKLEKTVPLRLPGEFPLILPEADSDVRRVLDPVVQRKR